MDWTYWKRNAIQPKNNYECVVCTLNSGAAATVFWTFDGTHEDEKMIWFGFHALQNQVIIRTSNTAKSVFCMTNECVKQSIHAWVKKKKNLFVIYSL